MEGLEHLLGARGPGRRHLQGAAPHAGSDRGSRSRHASDNGAHGFGDCPQGNTGGPRIRGEDGPVRNRRRDLGGTGQLMAAALRIEPLFGANNGYRLIGEIDLSNATRLRTLAKEGTDLYLDMSEL